MPRSFTVNPRCFPMAAKAVISMLPVLLIALTLSTASQAQGPALTTISDTVYRADGTAASGTVLISWPSFQTAEGDAVAAGNLAVTIGPGGAFSAQLVPNVGASPAGTYYVVVFQLDDGTVRTEYWAIPATSPTTIAAVLTTPGTGLGNLAVTQQYVNGAVANRALDTAVVHLAGTETITGTKQFAVPPALPVPAGANDAANKGYVDAAVANVGSGAYVSKAGDTMTGPLSLPADPAAPNQAADRHYVDAGLAVKADLVNSTIPTGELGAGIANATTCLNGNSTWGSCGGGAPAGITYATTALNWTQPIASPLTGGSLSTVTLTPCPVGVDTTSGAGYQVLISGGGKSEAVNVVTGAGGCTSGATSGTITFTPFYSYAAGYTIGSASSGIQETINAACGAMTTTHPNGQCNVTIPANGGPNNLSGPTSDHPLSNYLVYGTIYFHAGQSVLSGYGVSLNCLGRGPCLQLGDLLDANHYADTTVKGIHFRAPVVSTGDPAYAGSAITSTVVAGSVATITTASPHGFRPGDIIVQLFTDDASYWGDAIVTTVPSSTTYTYAHTGTIAPQTTPGVTALAYEAVLDNANSSHFIDVGQDGLYGESRHFNNFFDMWDDENAVIDHFNNSAISLNGNANWNGSFVFSGGAANVGHQLAPVITIRDSNITANDSSCVTDYNSNGLYFENTVCQATGLWQVYASNTTGNYQGAYLKDIYTESSTAMNPGAPARTPFPGLGIAGLIAGKSTGAASFSVTTGGSTGLSGGIPSGGTGSTPYSYYIVANFGGPAQTYPMLILNWLSTGSDSIPVNWPRLPGAISYDVIRTTTPDATHPAPYNRGCPGGSGGACGSVATAISQASACSGGLVCTYTDTGSSTTAAYTVQRGNAAVNLTFWPGTLVSVNQTVTTDRELAPVVAVGLSDNPIQVTARCSGGGVASPGGYTICLESTTGSNPNQTATLMADGTVVGGAQSLSKGRLNFSGPFGALISSHHIITLLDSQPALTQATTGYRPLASTNDTWIGTDLGTSKAVTLGQLAFGAPVAISNYINNTGDGTNWLERLTSSLKEFNVNAKFDQGVTLAGLSNGCLNIASGVIASTGSPCGSGGTGGAVNSVFGRSGTVIAASGDYTVSQVTGAAADASVVHNTGTETIAGAKTFTGNVTASGNLLLPQGNGYVPAAGGIGLDTAAGLPVVNIGGTTQQIALTSSNISGQAGTALALAAAPTQCSGSFATGIAANGNANCTTANMIELAETSQPSDPPTYGVFWFDSATHTPHAIDNNHVIQMGLTNLFNSDPGGDPTDNLEELNGSTPQNLRVYSNYVNNTAWTRMSLGSETAGGTTYNVVRSEDATSGNALSLGMHIGSSIKWFFSSDGTFKPNSTPDGSYDIGTDTGQAMRSVFVKTSFNMYSTGRQDFEFPNDGTNGTTLNYLAVYNSSASGVQTASTASTDGVVGIVSGGAGTSNKAVLTWAGLASCNFDAVNPIAGDYVIASTTQSGKCHDSGSTTRPSGVQVIGKIESGGVRVSLAPPSGGGGGGAVASVFGRTGPVTATTGDYSVSQVTGAAADATVVHLAGAETISGAKTFSSDVTLSGNLNVAGNINQTGSGPTQWSGKKWTGTTVTVPSGMDFSLGIGLDNSFKCQLTSGASCMPTDAVPSVFGRTGAVVAGGGDYSVGQVTGAAPLASPMFTGTPSAPTANPGDNSTKLATTAFVQSALPTNSTTIPWLTFSHGGSNINFSTATNKAIFTGVVLDFAKTTSQVSYNVSTADNTSNTYDLGIYSGTAGGTCTQQAHIGQTAGTTFAASTGWKTTNWLGGSVTLQPGRYYLAYTTSCTTSCATLIGDTGGFTFAGSSGGANSNVSVTTGGTLPATATCPSDSYATTSAPNWAIN
ncbi:MAG: hypothetical protein LAO23_04005 [Acidobacteriia bacterium]|nr:hypothetical protein [Terriglobia bacterium]